MKSEFSPHSRPSKSLIARNSNIIEYKEAFFDQESECLCLVMEYAEKGDLESQIQA